MNPNELVNAATDALKHAHAPYSNYKVGAALLCADGTVFTGCNVENASFGLTNCAERSAVFAAVAAGQKNFEAIAIAASQTPAPFPCGACRQVLAEFCKPEIPVYVSTEDGIETTTLGELLPYGFSFGSADA